MSYLKHKDGSIEQAIKEMSKHLNDSAYQDMFKKELEKAGKGIGAMSDQEKKDFFNKIDKMYKAKSEELGKEDEKVVKKVTDMLKGASAKHAAQAKMLDKAMKEDTIVEKIEGLEKKAEKSGMPYSILKKVYDRGMAAYKTGHRPGTTAQQWAFARVNSFITKSSGTWGKADKDLADKVRGSKKEEVEEQKDNAYAIGMAAAKKKYNDEPPLEKKTIKKGHEIAKSIEKDMKEDKAADMERARNMRDKIADLQAKSNKLDKSTPAGQQKDRMVRADMTSQKLKLQDLMKKISTEKPKEQKEEKKKYHEIKKDSKGTTMTDKPMNPVDTEPKLDPLK